MSRNKQTVQEYMDAFARTDHARVLSCLTDDVEWVVPGAFHTTGKAAFDKEVENGAFVGSPTISVARKRVVRPVTPGWLRSEAMLEAYRVTEDNWRDATARSPHFAISESPAFVGRAVAALAQDPNVSRWNGKSLSSGQLAKIYGFTDLDGSQPDAWRYVTEVQDAGKPADVRGYP